MRVDQMQSGLLIPRAMDGTQKPTDVVRGPIELHSEDDRKRLGVMMQEILHMDELCGGVISVPVDRLAMSARRRLWRYFATELLGEEWECEELC